MNFSLTYIPYIITYIMLLANCMLTDNSQVWVEYRLSSC